MITIKGTPCIEHGDVVKMQVHRGGGYYDPDESTHTGGGWVVKEGVSILDNKEEIISPQDLARVMFFDGDIQATRVDANYKGFPDGQKLFIRNATPEEIEKAESPYGFNGKPLTIASGDKKNNRWDNMTKEAAAITRVIANMKQKFAELDALDEQFADLDADIPMDGMDGDIGEQFDLLSDKREELETEIRSMRERVQLISEWEKFKGGGWSDEIQSELNSIDQQFANIADGASSEPMGMPPLPVTPPLPDLPGGGLPVDQADAAPLVRTVPADASAEPPVTAAEPPVEAPAPPAEPLAAPMASTKKKAATLPSCPNCHGETEMGPDTTHFTCFFCGYTGKIPQTNEKINYETSDKKGSTNPSDLKKGDTHMANQPTKQPSLKEKLAEAKNKREAITKEAKTRVASAWTIAKTMLPGAPADVQKSFAASLLTNTSTKALKAALRQTAINAHYTKLAETFKEVHKVELNDLLEDPSILKAEKKSVESELKGEAKAAGKVADDRKESGPQPDKYDDGRNGSEPKEIDASKAADRPDVGEKPGQTQNLSDGKNAAKKATCGKDCKGCSAQGCKGKKAGVKKADEAPVEGEAPVEAPVEGEDASMEAPPTEEAPMDMPPPVEGDSEAEATEILTDEKKEILEEKIDEAQNAINAIEAEIFEEGEEELDLSKLDDGSLEGEGEDSAFDLEGEELSEDGEDGEELDFSKVFDQGQMEEKAASLANEGEEKYAGEEDDFFRPSPGSSLEASLDDDGMADMHSMFSMQGAEGDPLASLIAGLKTAEQVAGMDIVESYSEAAQHFEHNESPAESRNNESDHENDLWAETIEGITPEEQGAKRVPQDSTNQLEKPKAAVLKKIKTTTASDRTSKPFDIGAALFGSDED